MSDKHVMTLEAGKRGGRPCIRHMRIAVADVLGWLAQGMPYHEIIADFPELTEDDIRACLAYAADRERRVLTAPRSAVVDPNLGLMVSVLPSSLVGEGNADEVRVG